MKLMLAGTQEEARGVHISASSSESHLWRAVGEEEVTAEHLLLRPLQTGGGSADRGAHSSGIKGTICWMLCGAVSGFLKVPGTGVSPHPAPG